MRLITWTHPGAYNRMFHLFPDLPVEIRLKIWNLTTVPQFIRIFPTEPTHRYDWTAKDGHRGPVTLYANSESWNELRPKYEYLPIHGHDGSLLCGFFVNFSLDTLYTASMDENFSRTIRVVFGRFPESFNIRVQKLAISWQPYVHSRPISIDTTSQTVDFGMEEWLSVKKLANLNELTFMINGRLNTHPNDLVEIPLRLETPEDPKDPPNLYSDNRKLSRLIQRTLKEFQQFKKAESADGTAEDDAVEKIPMEDRLKGLIIRMYNTMDLSLFPLYS